MRNFCLHLFAVACLLSTALSVSAGAPQTLPLYDVYCAAETCSRVVAGEFYTPLNTPSTKCQCLGMGMGAGYHAPLCFGKPCTWRPERQGLNWLPTSPVSCACGCDDWSVPSSYNSCGSADYGCPAGGCRSQQFVGDFQSQHSTQNGIFSAPSMPVPQLAPQVQTNARPLKAVPKRLEPKSPSSDDSAELLPMPSI